MGFIFFVAFIWIVYRLFTFFKNSVTKENTQYTKNSGTSNQVRVLCPTCNSHLLINHEEANWTCNQCRNVFIYYKDEVYKSKEYHSIIAMYLTAILAKFSKLDGVVTRQELSIVENRLISFVQPSAQELKNLKALFNREVKTPEEFASMMERLAHLTFPEDNLYQQIGDFLLHSFLEIYYFNNPFTNNLSTLEQGIFRLLNLFNIDSYYYESLKSQYEGSRTQHEDGQYGRNEYEEQRNYNQHSQQYTQSNIQQYFEILGLDENATAKEVKKRYRELSLKYHPDTVAGKDLEPEIVKLVENKFKEINKAYKELQKYYR